MCDDGLPFSISGACLICDKLYKKAILDHLPSVTCLTGNAYIHE